MEVRAFFFFSFFLLFVILSWALGLRFFFALTREKEREGGTSRGFSIGTFYRVSIMVVFSSLVQLQLHSLATWDAVLFSFRFFLVIMRLHGKATYSVIQRGSVYMVEHG